LSGRKLLEINLREYQHCRDGLLSAWGPVVTSISDATPAEPPSKSLYVKAAILIIGVLVAVTTARFSGFGRSTEEAQTAVDFHAFYAAAQMVWRGTIDQAYHIPHMMRRLAELTGRETPMPWSYPPPFDLVVAPLSFLPLGAAYFTFTTLTLAAYLAVLRYLSGHNFAAVLLSVLPALVVTISCGQNGFLTGALVGVACTGLLHRHPAAGVPLGVMIIKPHLAIGLALYAVMTCRWRIVLVAAATVAITSAVATALLGAAVWTAFFSGLQEARVFLEAGLYPLHRMISPFTALLSLGAPAALAFWGQAAAALLSLALIGLAIHRNMAPRLQLGIAVIGSLLVSPYAYDYDLTLYGIGLALVLPDLLGLATPREQATVFGLSFFTSAWGLAQTAVYQVQFGPDGPPDEIVPLSIGGFTLVLSMLLISRILGRGHRQRPVAANEPDQAPA
jgi:hypothetical protein